MSQSLRQSVPGAAPAATNRSVRVAAATWAPRLFLVLATLAAAWAGTLPLTTVPAVVPATSPAGVFSAARALEDLAFVAAQPHPSASPANEAVRDYLLAEIAKLGLAGEVQRTTVAEIPALAGIAQVTPVENVAVRLPGTAGGGKAVLITGHYDSVPTTPGAGDCGSCVVTVLETLRAVKAGAPLQNDVIFLFTDGEELGVVGATAFMKEHPWAQDVALSIVLEGLGTRGSALLYTAGPNHGGVVLEALDAMAEPGAYAYLNDVMWKLAGNSGSDLDAFLAGGRPGLAFVHLALEGSQVYHSGGDNVQALDAGTLQQHGEQALSLVRHFGNVDLARFSAEAGTEPDPVYFSLFPGVVVRYGQATALALAIAAALTALAAVVYGWRRRAFGLPGLLAGVLTAAVGLVLVLAVTTGVWWLLRLWNPNLHMYSVGGWYGAGWTTAGLALLSLALLAALQWLWRRLRLGVAALVAGGLLWWAALALLTAQGLPGFGYLFALPLVPAALAAAWLWWNPPAAQQPWLRALVLAVPAVVAILLITPVVYGLAVFGQRMEALTGLPLAALPLPFVVLGWLLLAQQAESLAPVRRWQLPVVLGVLAGLCLAAGWARSGFDVQHPKLNTAVYWLDADAQSARWITVDDSRSGRGTGAQIDEWTAQFFAEGATPTLFNPWISGWFNVEYPALTATAPLVVRPQSHVTVLEERVEGGARILRLQIAQAEGVQDIYLQLQGTPEVRIVALNGEAVAGGAAPSVHLNVIGRQPAPVTVDVRMPAGAPLQVIVYDRLLGLPEEELAVTPRPTWMAAAPFNTVSDSTIVAHTVTIE